ncbi:hypothetical protein Tco_1399717 [Tanacetum coccineum]
MDRELLGLRIEDKDSFELKGQFLKELRDNTFIDSDHEDANEHIEKVLEIVDLFHILNITLGPNTPYGSSQRRIYWTEPYEMYETKQMTIPFLIRLNGYCCEEKKGSYGPQFSEAYLYGASHNSIPIKEEDLGSFTLPCFINNVCFNNALADLGASVSVMPLSTYLNLGLGELAHTKLTVELADRTVKYPKGIAENVLVGIGKFVFPVDFIILDMPEDIKVPLILERPFLSTAHAKIDVFKRKITLRVGEEKIIFKSVKPARSLIKRVYMLSLRERMELDLEARLMGETLVLNRSLDPFFEDYIELNNLNVPLELRRDQVDDLIPTIEEGDVVEEFKARNDARMIWMPYRDDGMGDVYLWGIPFLREVGINAKQFEDLITNSPLVEDVTFPKWRDLPSEYTDADIADFETRLAGIYRREIHRVQNKDWPTSQKRNRQWWWRIYDLEISTWRIYRVDADREVLVPETFHEQTDDELTEAEIKQMEADDQANSELFLSHRSS